MRMPITRPAIEPMEGLEECWLVEGAMLEEDRGCVVVDAGGFLEVRVCVLLGVLFGIVLALESVLVGEDFGEDLLEVLRDDSPDLGEDLLDFTDVRRVLPLAPERVVLAAGAFGVGTILLGAIAHCCAHCIRFVTGSNSLHGVLVGLLEMTLVGLVAMTVTTAVVR